MPPTPNHSQKSKIQNNNNTKYEVCNLYILQIKNLIFLNFPQFYNSSNVFWHCWCILYNKSIFGLSYSDSVYVTVYGNIG